MAQLFSSSKTISLLLGTIIVAGGFASYQFGNFGGVSHKELNEGFIRKSDVTFTDLPLQDQERYIDKDAIIEQSKEANLLDDEFLDESGKPIPESEITQRDLKRFIQKLQKTLLFLQHDNLIIANEKNDLLKKLDDVRNESEDEKNLLLNKNIEKINEAEQQHYKNISDLTIKINELQKDNVLIAQKSNIENNALKNTIDELKSKMSDNEQKKYQEIQKAREDEQAKLIDYKEKIKLLNDQISLLNEQINTNTESAKTAITRKMDEISKLKEEITLLSKEKNTLLSANTQTLVGIDQKHKSEIEKYNQSIEQLKKDTEKLIASNRKELANQEDENQKKIALWEEKVKLLNAELASSKKHIDALMLENEKDFNKFRTYLEDEKKLNKELVASLKKGEENSDVLEKSLNATILKQKEELAKKEGLLKEFELKISALGADKINTEAEIKRKVDENDRIHNKNYKAFNEKIANFELAKQEMLSKLDKQLNEYKAASEENYKKMQFHSNELTRLNSELKTKYELKEKESLELKELLSIAKKEQQKTQELADVKSKEVKSAYDELRSDVKTKEGEYLSRIQSLEAQMRAKEAELLASKKEESLNIGALDKKIKNYEVDLLALKDELSRKDDALKSLHVKTKNTEDENSKAQQKQMLELQTKLALLEKSRKEDDAKLIVLKEEQKRKELAYLDQIKEIEKLLKSSEKSGTLEQNNWEKKLLASEQTVKTLQEKLSLLEKSRKEDETKLISFKEEQKRKELAYLDQIKEIEKSLKSSEKSGTLEQNNWEKKLLASEQTVKMLQEKVKLLEVSTTKASAAQTEPKPIAQKGKKLQVLDSVTCTDMESGTNAISKTCQSNVNAFLAKYDNTHYFEVAPIVDNGGFASLKFIKSKKVGVEESEIDRISGLANIGLGKARAKAGGELVENVIGEGAKISYALSNIEQDKARGFQIKVLH